MKICKGIRLDFDRYERGQHRQIESLERWEAIGTNNEICDGLKINELKGSYAGQERGFGPQLRELCKFRKQDRLRVGKEILSEVECFQRIQCVQNKVLNLLKAILCDIQFIQRLQILKLHFLYFVQAAFPYLYATQFGIRREINRPHIVKAVFPNDESSEAWQFRQLKRWKT